METHDYSTFQRSPHDSENPYSMVSNDLIRDRTISPACRWLIIYLLSNKDGWKISIKQIVNHCKGMIGRDQIYGLVNEAIDAGYMNREEYSVNNMTRIKYFVSEKPKYLRIYRRPGFQDPENQDAKEEHSKERKEISKDISKEAAPPPKTENEKPKISEKAYELAKIHRDEVKAICPKSREPCPTTEAKNIELMLTKDNRTEEEIRLVIDFLFHKDTFWYKNTLSTSKLRKNFDRLWLEMNSKKDGENKWKTKSQNGFTKCNQDLSDNASREQPLPPQGLIMKMLQK